MLLLIIALYRHLPGSRKKISVVRPSMPTVGGVEPATTTRNPRPRRPRGRPGSREDAGRTRPPSLLISRGPLRILISRTLPRRTSPRRATRFGRARIKSACSSATKRTVAKSSNIWPDCATIRVTPTVTRRKRTSLLPRTIDLLHPAKVQKSTLLEQKRPKILLTKLVQSLPFPCRDSRRILLLLFLSQTNLRFHLKKRTSVWRKQQSYHLQRILLHLWKMNRSQPKLTKTLTTLAYHW